RGSSWSPWDSMGCNRVDEVAVLGHVINSFTIEHHRSNSSHHFARHQNSLGVSELFEKSFAGL
ncbi:MAG: hypothetical protein Q9M26_02975, partial [Mariprofundales bacterium]|nr:hypothetical protein [Mariprofundales bacterium]